MDERPGLTFGWFQQRGLAAVGNTVCQHAPDPGMAVADHRPGTTSRCFRRRRLVLLSLLSLSFAGCYGAAQFVSYAPELLRAGAGAIAGMEDVDLKAAISPGVTPDDLRKIRRVSVVIGARSSGQTAPQFAFSPLGGDLTNIMADNIALELLNLGFQVMERASLDKVISEQGLQISDIADPATAAKIGRILGVDAIVLGNVATSQRMQMRGGFFGVGSEFTTVQTVSDATMRVVGVEQANVLMLVTLSYRKGQKPTEASKTMAIALAEKIKNPAGPKGSEK